MGNILHTNYCNCSVKQQPQKRTQKQQVNTWGTSPNITPRREPKIVNNDPDIYTYFLDTPWQGHHEIPYVHDGRIHPLYKGQQHTAKRHFENNLDEQFGCIERETPLRKFDNRKR